MHRNSLTSYGLVPYQIRSRKERIAFLILSAVTGLIILAIAVYYVSTPSPVIGSQLVNRPPNFTQPFEIPPPSISPFYVKPITILFASILVFAFCLCALAEPYITRYLPRWLNTLLLLLSVLLFGMGVYEVFFNFSIWSALIAANPGVSPDLLYNQYPINTVKNNLAYATKISVDWCVVSFFSLMTFRASLIEKPSEQTSRAAVEKA